jgi:hypothetical protein
VNNEGNCRKYVISKARAEIGRIGRVKLSELELNAGGVVNSFYKAGNFDINGVCTREGYSMCRVSGDLPKSVLGCDIDDVFYQVGEVRREVTGWRDTIITKSVGAGCELEYRSCNMAEDTAEAGAVGTSNIVIVTKIISKINSLFVTVVAGSEEGMQNINSTINYTYRVKMIMSTL